MEAPIGRTTLSSSAVPFVDDHLVRVWKTRKVGRGGELLTTLCWGDELAHVGGKYSGVRRVTLPDGRSGYVGAALRMRSKGILRVAFERLGHGRLGPVEVEPGGVPHPLGNPEIQLLSLRLRLRGELFDRSEAQSGALDEGPERRVVLVRQRVVLLEIEKASHQPVRFKTVEYVRVGSYKKKLKDHPEKERELWRIFDRTPFEERLAASHVASDEVLSSLDYPAYFELLQRPLPDNRSGILEALADDGLIRDDGAGAWDITNLGAVLFAKRLDSFEGLKRKAMRVIRYQGDSRVQTVSEQVGAKGYASGFEGLIDFVNGLLPSNEVVGKALRRTVPMYPEIAVREIVANALIHQDFSVSGAGPMVEIFDGRLEVTSPGEPLMPTDRFVDCPPRSRNEGVASLMRRMGVCEERGSGIDKVVFQTELYQLPAPLFEVTGGATRVVLFSPKPLADMDKADRIRACYLHACLRYVSREFLTNSSLRERFGIKKKNSAKASRLIKEAVDAGRILPHDPNASNKNMKYVPFWAAEVRS